jgi:hypothetical protein
MISSHEVRWFLEGGVDQYPDLRRWVEEGAADPHGPDGWVENPMHT